MDKTPLDSLEEGRLITDTLKGNLSSFEKIVLTYQDMIYRHSQKILKDHDKAEDATQITFIKIYENLKKYKKDLPLKPWIFRISTNVCYDMIRKDQKIVKLTWDIRHEKESTLEKIIKKETYKGLWRAIEDLPQKYKIPITGFYFENLSYKTLSAKLQIPINTIKTRIRRGRKFLYKELI